MKILNPIETEREDERILRVYRSYVASVRERWDPQNVGNQLIENERWHITRLLFQRHAYFPLENLLILDVGCGVGKVLGSLLGWGARTKNCTGIDLVPERIEEARKSYPTIRFLCANAESMEFPDTVFDLVVISTVFSSILNNASKVAQEIVRVLKPGGSILWYDFRYNNPGNPHVRGMPKGIVRQLFPDFEMDFCTTTLLPPLARRLGRWTPVLYPMLASIPALRTHYIGLLIKSRHP